MLTRCVAAHCRGCALPHHDGGPDFVLGSKHGRHGCQKSITRHLCRYSSVSERKTEMAS